MRSELAEMTLESLHHGDKRYTTLRTLLLKQRRIKGILNRRLVFRRQDLKIRSTVYQKHNPKAQTLVLNHNIACSHTISNLQISKTLSILNKPCKNPMKYTCISLYFHTCYRATCAGFGWNRVNFLHSS